MIRIHRHSNPILLLIIIFACLITSSMPNGLIQAFSNASPSDGAGNNQNPVDSDGSISNAKSVYDTLTMLVSSAVKSVILTVVDEAHEPPASIQKHVSDHNPFLVPTNLIMPRGVTLSILDADAPWDTPHPHTIDIKDNNSGKMIYTTGKLDYTNSSKPVVLPTGKYVISDRKYPWISGLVTVLSNETSPANAHLTVGAFYTTTNKVLNNKDNDGGMHPGWLGYYRTEFPLNGFQILSEYNFHYAECKYCPSGFWPDLKSANQTLLIYSTNKPLSDATSNLARLVWNNIYI